MGAENAFPPWIELIIIAFSPHMRKLYGDSLRKDAGFTKIIKKVAVKNARLLESRAGRHAPEIRRVAQEVKGSFDKVIEETAEVVEEFLNKCKLIHISVKDDEIIECRGQPNRKSQRSCKRLKCCCNNLEKSW